MEGRFRDSMACLNLENARKKVVNKPQTLPEGSSARHTVIVIGQPASEETQRTYDCIKLATDVFPAVREFTNSPAGREMDEIADEIDGADHVVLLLNEQPPEQTFRRLCRELMAKCTQSRQRNAHLVLNIGCPWLLHLSDRRAERMLRLFDLTRRTVSDLMAVLDESANDSSGFSSPGESFAWQLVFGFLAYILPGLETRIRAGCIKERVSREFGLAERQVLVLPRYFLLLDEQVACCARAVEMTPVELFPGCQKVRLASGDLTLEFDSPGYKKRIPAYLLKLDEPLSSDSSTAITHAVVFAGYAAPQFVMSKINGDQEQKKRMFQDFKAELEFIVSHPKFGRILGDFSDSDCREWEDWNPLQLIDVQGGRRMKDCIVQSVKDHRDQSWVIISTENFARAEEDTALPLMSMAFAMAANCWFGFGQLLLEYGRHLEFDWPYCFVIPKSGRYPDEAKLRQRFSSIGADSKQLEFMPPCGRRYTLVAYQWRSRRLAFEIPASVLGLRRQAECRLGGVTTGDLAAHLGEFKRELDRLLPAASGGFKTIEWDDASLLDLSSGAGDLINPSKSYARSLLNCCLQAVTATAAPAQNCRPRAAVSLR